jgi:hypothetical protein
MDSARTSDTDIEQLKPDVERPNERSQLPPEKSLDELFLEAQQSGSLYE